MKVVLLSALFGLVSLNAVASMPARQVKFKAVDQSAETQLCVAAAQGGLAGVKQETEKFDLNFYRVKKSLVCNGYSLTRFARQFEVKSNVPEVKSNVPEVKRDVTFKFIAADKTVASQICADVMTNGYESVASKYENIDNVYCNGQIISRFVKQFKG